jgi:phosphoserine phosphatase RsbU/P
MASDVDSGAELQVPGLSWLLDSLDQAVIVQDTSGRIRLLNQTARRLFPELRLGDDFGRSGESFVAEPRGRRVRGRLRRLPEGWYAWVVSDTSGDTSRDTSEDTGPDVGGETGGGSDTGDTSVEDADEQNFMLEASRQLRAGMSHDAAAAALVRLAVPAVGEQAAALLPAPRARVQWWHFADGATEPAQGLARAPAPRTAPVLAKALRGATEDIVTVPTCELVALAAVLGSDVAERTPIVAAPIRGPDRTEGLLIVVRPIAPKLFLQLAVLAGPTIEASRRRRDEATALALLQAPLLPPQPDALPTVPGVQLGVAYRAAGELAVGGDFYLIRRTLDGGALLALGDVCGKGAEALAESARVQHSLAALMVTEQDPAGLLYLLNRALLAGGRTVFTTLVLGALRSAGKDCRLTLATGGHPAPMVLRSDGRVEEIGIPGTVVGILPDARFGRSTITLRPGEACLLYSDGATEAGRRTGDYEEQFGSARLANCLRNCAGMTAQALASSIKDSVIGWLGRNDGDDLAVLAIRAVEREA